MKKTDFFFIHLQSVERVPPTITGQNELKIENSTIIKQLKDENEELQKRYS